MEFYISTRRRVKLHSDVLWRALMRKPRSEYPSEQADKFLVRLPDGMRDQLAEAAKLNKRSMNAEIVARLEWSLEAGVVEEIGTDISRAMTWADHTKAMGLMVQQAAGTIRELKSEVAAMRFEMHALRQTEGLPDPQESGVPDREKHSDKAKKP